MKTKILLLLTMLISISAIAQSGINYKGIIKDGSGNILANQSVDVQFIIYEGAALTNNVYQESHTTNTDANGIIVINIGEGTTADVFTDLAWGNDEHWLNVQVDTGAGLTNLGTTQFMAVPYAQHSETAETATTVLNLNGLEKIDEGSGFGWRLIGKDPNNYGNIGINAVDLSTSQTTSSSFGATGGFSIAMGDATTASGPTSISMGRVTEASGSASTVMGVNTKAESFAGTTIGRSNIGGGDPTLWVATDPLFEVGNGSSATPANALTILKNGTIAAPSLTNALIDISGDKSLISKEYADLNYKPSGLESIDEGNGLGYRLIGADPSKFGNIGLRAVDLTFSISGGSDIGATGRDSFAAGQSAIASGFSAIAIGEHARATEDDAVAIGTFSRASGGNSFAFGSVEARSGFEFAIGFNNIKVTPNDTQSLHPLDRLFVIGNGGTNMPSDAFRVLKNGTVVAPDLSLSLIDTAEDKVLITREYVSSVIRSHDNDLFLGKDAGSAYTGSSLNNVGLGPRALQNNETGQNNTAIGQNALQLSNHNSNTAIGSQALGASTSGFENTAVGRSALSNNSTGDGNTGIGYSALSGLTTGDNNTGIGNGAQVPVATASNQVQIGNGAVDYAGVQVAWTISSDKRRKNKIRDLPYGLNMVSKLRPVDYVRKNNQKKTREAGFIAQEVQQLLIDLNYEDQGLLAEADDGYLSLRYNDFIPVLVKAIQQQQTMIQKQQNQISELKSLVQNSLNR